MRDILFAVLAALAVPAANAADPGKAVYDASCATCHGANGKGALPGVPDLTKKDGVLSQPEEVLLKRTMEGFQSPGSPLAMPPRGGNPSLTEAQAREALKYMKNTFAKQAP